MKTPFLKLALAAAISLATQGIFAAEKVALVIGNSIYKDKNLNLKNPVNDAKDMKAALEKVGFKVIYVENATIDQMDEVRKEFRKSLDSDSLALLYYSGHGIQADGINYLIPSDAKLESKADLKRRAYDVGYFLDEMSDSHNRANIIILDACRNNPLKTIRAISSSKGLTAPTETPEGSIIAFATAPNSVASDNPLERNGIYTKYLKQYLFEPGLTIEAALKKVSKSVKQNSDSGQVPWYNTSLDEDLCLAGCSVKPSVVVKPQSSPPLLSFVSGADSTNQNKSYTVKFKATDSDGDLSKILIDWGDGKVSSKTAKNGATVSFSYTYKFAGMYDLIATAIDKQNNESETFDKSVEVKEVAAVTPKPVVPIVTTPTNSTPTVKKLTSNTSIAGQTYSLQLQASDADKNLSLLTIDWGDGASNFENLSGASSTVNFLHTYLNSGSYTWTATVYDSNDAAGSKSETIIVTQPVVSIVIPSVDNATALPSSIISGNSISFSATLSETLPSGYSVKVDYGNGLVSMSGNGTNYSVSATPIKLGAQTFTVGIYDNKGALLKSNQITGNFSVSEPAPVVVEKPVETPKPSTTKGDIETFVSGDRTFSYTKIANDGSELPKDAQLGTGVKDWACTKDNNTGLIWEVKTDDGGLRDKDWTYSWYNPYRITNLGYENSTHGMCSTSDNCNTYAFTNDVNKQGLCGAKDWRLPTIQELSGLLVCSDGKYEVSSNEFGAKDSIVCTNYYNVDRPTINKAYFSDITENYWFWSFSSNSYSSGSAWAAHFGNGYVTSGSKSGNGYVRLIRDVHKKTQPVVTTTKGDVETFLSGDRTFSYTKIANDGSELPKTAKLGTGAKDWACTKDNNTGLIWEIKTDDGGLRDKDKTYTNYTADYPKCNESHSCNEYDLRTGKLGDSTNTDGFVNALNKQGLCGAKDWRLPESEELRSLVFCSDGKYNDLSKEDGFICQSNEGWNLNTESPTINTIYFPNTQQSGFWSPSPAAGVSYYARYVDFYGGNEHYDYKNVGNGVRLVSGVQQQ